MKVGIIGESGSGKSTLADIILGLLKPENGEIEIDGLNITKDFKQLRKIISYVPQQIYMIDDTILHNIAFGVQEEKINKNNFEFAIKNAQIDNFINSLDYRKILKLGKEVLNYLVDKDKDLELQDLYTPIQKLFFLMNRQVLWI